MRKAMFFVFLAVVLGLSTSVFASETIYLREHALKTFPSSSASAMATSTPSTATATGTGGSANTTTGPISINVNTGGGIIARNVEVTHPAAIKAKTAPVKKALKQAKAKIAAKPPATAPCPPGGLCSEFAWDPSDSRQPASGTVSLRIY